KPITAPIQAGDSNLSLGEEIAPPESLSHKSLGSDIAGSAIDLSGDDDLVLGGSGSDVTGKPGDSGISLMDPSDSGLSLDEPMELGGSTIEGASLVLGEDDMITLGGEADVSAATQLKSDDGDFLLTPSSTAGDESESGSQVIALDSLEGFDESPTQVAGAAASMRMLEEDVSGADTMVGGPGMIAAPAGMPGMQGAPGMMMAPAIPEAPYSIWNVLSLFVCVALLCVIGMMMYDMMRNIWSWDQAYPINSSLMEAMIDMFKGNK
ncbi:MAG: hypothetical protein K8T25_15870, partial [Planctomycetia bacterium]|nr:hypothetical protein [Planctomycetia bacterium]